MHVDEPVTEWACRFIVDNRVLPFNRVATESSIQNLGNFLVFSVRPKSTVALHR